MLHTKLSRFTWLAVLLTTIMLAILTTDIVPWLRGAVPWLPGRSAWVWSYGTPRWQWLFVAILAFIIYLWGGFALVRRDQKYPVPLILWASVSSALLALLLMSIEQNPLYLLFSRSISLQTGGYQQSATLITDLGETLRHWTTFMQQYFDTYTYGSIPTSPPGLTIAEYSTIKALEHVPALASSFAAILKPLQCQNLTLMTWTDAQLASTWVQMFMPFFAALGVAPLYQLGCHVFNRETARWTVLLWPLVPGLGLFIPRFNLLFVVMAVVMLSLLWQGLNRRRAWPIFWAGFILSMGTFFNSSLFPLGIVAGVTIMGHALHIPTRLAQIIRALIFYGVGCISVWLIYWALVGINPLEIARIGFEQHVVQHVRPYAPWLLMHPYDMFLFVGLPICLLMIKSIRVSKSVFPPSRGGIFGLAGIVALIVADISGTARGETGRLWLFFAPIWMLIAAAALTRLQAKDRAVLVILQAIYCVSLAAVLRVNVTDFTVPPDVANANRPPKYLVNAQFFRGTDVLTLVGFDIEQDDTTWAIALHWRADSFIRRPYVLSVIPVRPDNSYEKSINWNPQDWNYPPTCWVQGREFVDTVPFRFEIGKMPGNWLFSISISDVFTHEPMRVGINQDIQIGIGPVQLP